MDDYIPASKVIIGGQTIVDLTSDTVNSSNLLEGITAHTSTGAQIIGSMTKEDIIVSGGTVSQISGTDSDYLLTLA